MFKYKILKYSIIIFLSIIFLLLLRITYKPLDVSFLNSNSINFKGYIDNFENISTEKIVLDFDLLKNRVSLNLGSIKLKKYNKNISNINARNVSAVIKISNLIKKSIIIEAINISNGNIDIENITINTGSKEHFSNLLQDIPVKHISLKNINLNLYKEESRIAVVNNINGQIQKKNKNFIFDSFSVDFIEHLDRKSKNKLTINNLLVSNKYTDNYIISIDSLDLNNLESLINIKHFKNIKNFSLKAIIANYNINNKKISLEGDILFKDKINKINLKGIYNHKILTKALVKINLKNFPLISLIEEKIIKRTKYSLKNVDLNFNGNINLSIDNNKLSNIDLDIASIKKSEFPVIININNNTLNINKIVLKANYKNNKINIHQLKINSLEGNIYLDGNITNLWKTLDYYFKLELENFNYSNFMNIVNVQYPSINQNQAFTNLIKEAYIKSLVLNVDNREEDLNVTLIQASIKNTNLEFKENLKLAIPQINIKSDNDNNIIVNIKSSKLFNDNIHANLSNTEIILDKYSSINDIKNHFEVTTNINTKYNSFYRLISELELEVFKNSYVKSIDGNIIGLLKVRKGKNLEGKESLLYDFSAELKNFNLLEESTNEKTFIKFNDFEGELLVDNNGTKIKGKTNINGSISNVKLFIDNLSIMTAHIDTNAKASSFNFLKKFNYLKSGTSKLNIIITKDLNSKNWKANVKSDVFASDINLDFINYKKPSNTRGNLTATFFFSGNKITKIKKLNFYTDNIIIKGSLYFDDDIKIKEIKLDEYINEKNNFSAVLTFSKNDNRTMKIDGASIDLINFIKINNKKKNNLIFSLNIQKLFYGDKYLGEAILNAKIKNSLLQNIEGKLLDKSKPYLHFNDIPYEEKKFKKVLFRIDDLGLFLNKIKLSESFIEGNGDIFIILDKENFNIQSGDINISDSSVKNSSFLARLLQLASFTGLLEILTNEGIPFNKIVGEFSVNNKVVNIRNLKFKGFSLGGTVKGNINLSNDKINLEGIIVPAYAINSLINKIPLVGQIITGIEGEGLIGVNYKAKGTTDKPVYNINPLSILTPGIMRNVFNFLNSDEITTTK